MNNRRLLIQWDNASRRYPFRVVSLSGECLGYFRDAWAAIDYVEGRAA